MHSAHQEKTDAGLTRRDFIWLSAASTAAVLSGCATNPATGRRQLMLVSRSEELAMDKEVSPHQFSADYGAVQDSALNRYVTLVGDGVAAVSDRRMPYSFRVVNAAYVNAYAFPGGSIAATRGILLKIENEAELASLFGHEIGHVCARHTAEQMSKTVATSLVLAGVTAYVEAEARKYAPLAAGLGQVGAGMLLARYSRDNEREADALGLKYMTRAGCGAEGFVGLMKMLNDLSESRSGMVDLLFSTHPMSRERYQTAVKAVDTSYAAQRGLPLNRDRFMDSTAALRQMKEAVEAMQRGDEAMMQDKAREAETQYGLALKKAPDDYAALLMMAKCQLAQKKHPAACRYSSLARQAYPQEAQACHVSGLSRLMNGEFSSAYEDFAQYDRMLPGNPNTTFYKGLCLEKMNRRRPAAQEYADYLQQAPDGEHADYARTRLAEWGYGRRRRQG